MERIGSKEGRHSVAVATPLFCSQLRNYVAWLECLKVRHEMKCTRCFVQQLIIMEPVSPCNRRFGGTYRQGCRVSRTRSDANLLHVALSSGLHFSPVRRHILPKRLSTLSLLMYNSQSNLMTLAVLAIMEGPMMCLVKAKLEIVCKEALGHCQSIDWRYWR